MDIDETMVKIKMEMCDLFQDADALSQRFINFIFKSH